MKAKVASAALLFSAVGLCGVAGASPADSVHLICGQGAMIRVASAKSVRFGVPGNATVLADLAAGGTLRVHLLKRTTTLVADVGGVHYQTNC